jgi:hypothetical protein
MSLLVAVQLVGQSPKQAIAVALDVPEIETEPGDLALDGRLLGFELVEVGERRCAGRAGASADSNWFRATFSVVMPRSTAASEAEWTVN